MIIEQSINDEVENRYRVKVLNEVPVWNEMNDLAISFHRFVVGLFRDIPIGTKIRLKTGGWANKYQYIQDEISKWINCIHEDNKFSISYESMSPNYVYRIRSRRYHNISMTIYILNTYEYCLNKLHDAPLFKQFEVEQVIQSIKEVKQVEQDWQAKRSLAEPFYTPY